MALLNVRHSDPVGAAISVASNRADKCEALRRSGLHDIADRSAARLHQDVTEWLSATPAGTGDRTAFALHDIVARAQGKE